jgi:glutaredoxin
MRRLQVTLLRKRDCGLCDHAAAALSRISHKVPLTVEHVDIDEDEALQARYFLEIPVVLVDGVEVARAPIRERALEETLRELARS